MSLETNPQVNLVTTTIQCSCLSLMWWTTLWGLSVPSFFFYDARWSALYTMQRPSPSCPEHWYLVWWETRCVAQMKVAGHCSQCCFNWSLEYRPSLFSAAFKASLLSSLVCVLLLSFFFFCSSFCLPSWGVLIPSPSAVRVGLKCVQAEIVGAKLAFLCHKVKGRVVIEVILLD